MPGTTAFPTDLDNFPEIGPNTPENGAGVEHDVVHANEMAAIAALQAKVGIDGSAVPTSIEYRLATAEEDVEGLEARVTALEEAPGGGGAVSSVNGQVGEVVLGAADVGAASASHAHAAGDITSGEFDAARLASGAPTTDQVPTYQADGTVAWADQVGGGGGADPTSRTDIFTPAGSPHTITFEPWAKVVRIQLVGGGSGGHAGSVAGAGSAAAGGATGLPGSIVEMEIPVDALGGGVTVTVGSGGNGGAGTTGAITGAQLGTAGGDTSFGTIVAKGGNVSATVASAPGAQTNRSYRAGVFYSAAAGANSNSAPAQIAQLLPTSGAGGGALTAANVRSDGALGGSINSTVNVFGSLLNGGAGGVGAGAAGTSGMSVAGHVGLGGGGGAAGNTAGTVGGGAGGAGGAYGGGGGGGGGARTGTSSGAGGKGGDGVAIITQLGWP